MNKYSSLRFAKAPYDRSDYPLGWRPGMSADERRAWTDSLKAKITELMAFPETMYEMPVVNRLVSKDRGFYTVEKYEISPEPDLWMTFLLLTPKNASPEAKTPAVLCTPGTTWTKEALAGEDFWDLSYEPAQPRTGIGHRYYYANAMARHYVQRGFTALACEDLCVGEHGDVLDPHQVEKLLIGQGRSMMGVTVELRLAMMKWLKTRPWVDRDKLAVSGHSLGVDSLMHLCILDEEIKAFVYNDYICDWQERMSCCTPPENVPTVPWHMYGGMWKWYTYPDLLAAFAPRKLFITEGGPTSYLLRLKEAYTELGAADHFRYDYYPDYADPANRLHDGEELAKGTTSDAYLEYCNVVAAKHFFKFETAAPWLEDALK